MLDTERSDIDIERHHLNDIKDFIPCLQKIEYVKVDSKLAKKKIE